VPRKSIAAGLAALAVAAFTAPAGAQETQNFGDWTLACQDNNGQQVCQIGQRAVNTQSKRPILQIAVTYQSQQPVMRIITPLGVLLPQNLHVNIDGQGASTLPYVQCLPGGCSTTVKLEPETVKKLKSGQKFNVSFALPNQKDPVTVPMSLNGFTDALDALAAK